MHPDQIQLSAASDLGLHSFPKSQKYDVRHERVRTKPSIQKKFHKDLSHGEAVVLSAVISVLALQLKSHWFDPPLLQSFR